MAPDSVKKCQSIETKSSVQKPLTTSPSKNAESFLQVSLHILKEPGSAGQIIENSDIQDQN